MKTISVKTMRESDAYTIKNFVPSLELMKRAGEAIYKAADWKAPVAIICGKGNNAGDGFVAASCLYDEGVDCDIILLSDKFSEDGKYYFDIAKNKGVNVINYESDTDLGKYNSILDCIFGTGFSGPVKEPFADAIKKINDSGAYVVSADINSGLNGDTGMGELFVKSDLTVSIGAFKHGHFKGMADIAMKEKTNSDIGIIILDEE